MTAQLADGPIGIAHRRFADAVHKFVERQPVWTGTAARWSPGLYSRMRGSLSGSTAPRFGRRMPTSRPPARVDVIDWLATVDKEISRWAPGGGTTDRLKTMAAQSYRPQDCDKLDRWSDQLAAWATEAATLLGDAVVSIPLRGQACPNCRAKHYFRHRDGEVVRSPALLVSEHGAQCLACTATYGLEWLARLLGCEALPS